MNHRFFLAVLIIAGLFAAGKTEAVTYPEWDGYPPFYSMREVVEFQGNVYGATLGGIFRYDPETRNYVLYYKNYGLDSNDVRCVAAAGGYLYFGFASAGLMRFDPASERFERIRFPEYVPNQISINHITVLDDSTLFVGHSAGLDILNLRTEEVRTVSRFGTFAAGTKVNDVKLMRGKIWVCTPFGLATADADNPNLEIESSWNVHVYSFFGKPVELNCIYNVIDDVEDRIYIGTQEKGIIYFAEEENRFHEAAFPNEYMSIYDITTAGGKVWASANKGLVSKSGNFWSLASNEFTSLTSVCGAGDSVWVATMNDGLQCYTGGGYVDVAPVPGPRNTAFRDIELSGDGSVWTTSGYRHNYGDLLRFRDGVWSRYLKGNDEHQFAPNGVGMDNAGNLWVSLWGRSDKGPSGILVIPDAADAVPDSAPVPLNPERDVIKATIASYYVICTDVTRDGRGNMWAANYQLNQPDSDGGQSHNIEDVPSSGAVVLDGFPFTKYRHFSPASGDLETAKVTRIWVDDDGWVWLGTDSYGVMAVDYGDDPFDVSTPARRYSLKEANGLSSQRVTAFHHDSEGLMWVGTDGGLDLVRKKPGGLDVEDMRRFLEGAALEVYCIEVDRFGNKWVGTANGLVRINASSTAAEVFNTQSSGLFSDTVFSLKYDDARDVLWIGTDAGLNTLAVLGGQSADAGRAIRVYPNPFSIWGADSRCTFDNLLRDDTLRIYTFSGELVNELKVTDVSPGGNPFVTWNGRNFKNEYVGSGVYFFAGHDKNGHAFRDKMVIIRR